MLKRILNNLSLHADVWIAEWNKTSTERRRLQYGRIERLLRRAGERLAVFLLSVLVFSVVLSMLSVYAIQRYSLNLPVWITGESNLLSYFGTLWMVQTTIAALVYPIVIAFVAVLLRRRATAGLALRIYMLDAAVLPAGTSSIGLVTWMGLQYLALPYLPGSWIGATITGNSAWFVLNSALTTWFLYRTLRFLNDDERLETFERFAVHVALPRDVRSYLMGLLLSNAQKHGFVPGPDYLSDQSGPKILVFPSGEGSPCLSIALDTERQVADIRLRLFAWAALLWRRKARKQKPTPSFAALPSEYPTLVYPVQPGEVVDGEFVLARVRNGPSPGFVARSLLRRSVVLRPPPVRDVSYSTFEILEEVATEALELAEQHRYEAAFQLVANLADLHAALIRAGAFINDDGEADNATLLPDPYGFASRRIHERWLDVYRQLAESAVSNLPLSPILFERHAYLASRLVHSVRGERIEILEHVLHISGYLMYRLGLWWANKAEERGLIAHDAVTGAELPAPIGRIYERALKSFVEGWESLALWERRHESGDVEAVWKGCSRTVLLAAAQADQTVSMMLAAVARGDRAAALWLADSFLKWWDNHRHNYGHSESYGHQNQLVTVSATGREWSGIRQSLEGIPQGPEEVAAAADLAATVARRYWSDLRLIAILILLDWSPPNCPEDALAMQIIAGLVKGRGLKPGGEADNQPLADPRMVLFQLVRMQLIDEQYASRLDRRVEQAQELRRPDMVAGRVYGRSGADDVQSLAVAQAQLLATITSGAIVLRSLEELQQRWECDLQKLERFERLNRNLADCIKGPAYQTKRSNVLVLRKLLGLSDEIDESEEWARTALLGLAERTIQKRNATLRDAKVSQASFDKLGKEISDYVLGQENHIFPFGPRTKLTPELSDGNPRALTVNGVNKAPYTDPPLEEYSNLGTSLHDFVVKAISAGLVHGYVDANALAELRTDSHAAFLEDIAAQAESLRNRGLTPLLILPTRRVPECARPWRYQISGEPDIGGESVRMRRLDDVPSLVGYFYDVPAYEAPIEASCYVAPKEDFESVLYSTQPGGSCIKSSATPDGDHTLRLRFEWVFQLERR